MTCHSDGHLVVEGNQYPIPSRIEDVLAAERRNGRAPIIVIQTAGAIVVVSEQDLNPMLAKIIKAHLAGKWVMVMEPDQKLTGRNIGPDLEQRLEDVLAVLPIGWGEQPDKAEQLGITPRELAWALSELQSRGLAHRPKQGVWVKTPLAKE